VRSFCVEKPLVSIKRYEKSPDSLRELVELCAGFESLKPGDRVLIKPNLVGLDDKYPMSLYGVFTTSRLVQDMVVLLKDRGVENITIGEGSTRGKKFGVSTHGIYEFLGYSLLKERYGVHLVDLFEGPFEKSDFGEFQLEISTPALETDFFINMPALKTHNQAVLSLGLKNLKGCLSIKSRKFCHSAAGTLDHHLSLFVEKLRPALTVVDGIYGLEKGPFFIGKAVRMDALVASKDPLAADVIGAALTGIDARKVPHLKEYADRHGRSLSLERFDVQGTPLSELKHPLKWEYTWREDNTGPRAWDRFGIQGVSLPKYDKTLCTGCSSLYSTLLFMITSSFEGKPFNEIEVLTGKSVKPSGKANKTVLFGNCMIKANRKEPGVREAVLLKGCPPSIEDIQKALQACGIKASMEAYRMLRESLMDRYKEAEGFNESFYHLKA
jgi:uncharacterized protein (DUF362 family)